MAVATHGQRESDTRRRAIAIAQLEMLCESLPDFIVGSGIAAVVIVVATVDGASLVPRLSWLAFMFALTGLRLWHVRSLRHAPITAASLDRRRLEIGLLIAINGLSWGMYGFFSVTQESLAQSVIVIMLLTGMVASGTAFVSHLREMYGAFLLLAMGPIAVRCLSFGDREYTVVAVLIVVFLIVVWKGSRTTADKIVEFIRTRLENVDQFSELQEEKARADEARERAENANTAKSVFLSSASHDLRQPLHSLRLFSAALQSRLNARRGAQGIVASEEAAEDHRLVVKIDESVTALEELFEGILDLSRLDAGTVEVHFEHVPLGPIFDHLELAYAPAATAKGVTLTRNAHDAIVHSDPVMLERLLTNLVSNAVRYTEHGHIELSAVTVDGYVLIRVVDTGIGIAPENRARIFGEFIQLNNPERDRLQGVGLGLSIVKRLASLLEVTVRVDPGQSGVGTTFVVEVKAGDPVRVASSGAVQSASIASAEGLFALIIDDEESARLALEALIQNWGGTVLLAGSAAEAVEALKEIDEVPHIVISDYRLRDGETGTDAIEQVRQHTDARLPGLLITGDIDAIHLRDIDDTGLPLLHKPCKPDDVKRRIHELTGR